MKIYILLPIMLLVLPIVLADIPTIMGTQQILRNATTGDVFTDTYEFNYTLQRNSDNQVLWNETIVTPLDRGIASNILGQTIALDYTYFLNPVTWVLTINDTTTLMYNETPVGTAFVAAFAHRVNWTNVSGVPDDILNANTTYLKVDGSNNMEGILDMGTYNITNLTSLIFNDNVSIKLYPENENTAGDVLCFEMLGPSGNKLPHFCIQSGGASQASFVMRSMMIVNEEDNFFNTTNFTSCSAYMTKIGETLKIDCNTTTTGADLLVSDDMQVVGDAWFKDEDGEWHFTERTLSHQDEHYDDTILDKVRVRFYSVSNTTILNLYNPDDSSIEVNIDRAVYDWGVPSVNVTLINGTNSSPQINYVTVQESGGSLVLNAERSYPSVEHADVAKLYVGSDGYIISYNPIMVRNYEGPYKFYERFEKEGALYETGFDPSVSETQLNISTGSFNVVVYDIDCANEIQMTDGFFWVNNTGDYTHCTDLSCIDEYSDGTEFTNKFMNLVWGVVPQNLTYCNLVAVVQGYPGAGNEYVSADKAEADKYVTINYFPTDTELTKAFIPLVHTLLDGNNDDFDAFGSGQYYRFLGGKVTSGGGAPTPASTDHSALDNLAWSVSGHTIDTFLNVSEYDIIARTFNGSWNGSVDYYTKAEVYTNHSGMGYIRNNTAARLTDLNMSGEITVGYEDNGHNITAYGSSDSGRMVWNSTENTLDLTNAMLKLGYYGGIGLVQSEIEFVDNTVYIRRDTGNSLNIGAGGIILLKTDTKIESTGRLELHDDNAIYATDANSIIIHTDEADDDTGQITIYSDNLDIDASDGGGTGHTMTVYGDITAEDVTGDTLEATTQLLADVNSVEALLVRKNADGGDILTVDTTNRHMQMNGNSRFNGTINVSNSLYAETDYVSIAEFADSSDVALEIGKSHTSIGSDEGPLLRVWGNSQANYGDMFITQYGQLGFNTNGASIQFQQPIQISGDNEDLSMGNGNNGKLYLRHSTAGNDHGRIATKDSGGTESHFIVYSQWEDISYDYGFPDHDNPTLYIVSQNQVQDEYIMFQHNTVDAIIESGSQTLLINNTNVTIDGHLNFTNECGVGSANFFGEDSNALADEQMMPMGNGETVATGQGVPQPCNGRITAVSGQCSGTAPGINDMKFIVTKNGVDTSCEVIVSNAVNTGASATCDIEFSQNDNLVCTTDFTIVSNPDTCWCGWWVRYD